MNFGPIEPELIEKLREIDDKKHIEGFLKLPVFETENEGLLFLLIYLTPQTTRGEMVKDWGISETMADFLMEQIAMAMLFLGMD